jgi:DNA-binding response OmpR family regulator
MRKILLIDDDEDLLNSLGEFLEVAAGVTCLKARGLEELEGLRDAIGAEVAIVDVNLGQGVPSGIDVYRWLRKSDFPGKIVFLTGHAKEHPLVKEAAALGAAQVFAKPMDIDKLLSLLEKP